MQEQAVNDFCDKLPPAQLRITPNALAKAATYARLVAEEFDSPYESIGFLLTEPLAPGPEILITDVMLAAQQTASPGSAQISPRGVLASGREIERRRKHCAGWWHAHPASTFHSGTDDHNLQTVLEDVAVSRRWPLREPKRAPVRWEDGALVIRTETETIRITGAALSCLRLDDAPKEDPPALEAEVRSHALTASAAYSLVVSATDKSKPYAEMATQIHCAVCGQREVQVQQVNLELVDPDAPNPEAMREEVRRKVLNLPRRPSGMSEEGRARGEEGGREEGWSATSFSASD